MTYSIALHFGKFDMFMNDKKEVNCARNLNIHAQPFVMNGRRCTVSLLWYRVRDAFKSAALKLSINKVFCIYYIKYLLLIQGRNSKIVLK